jgi:hypothetical protein
LYFFSFIILKKFFKNKKYLKTPSNLLKKIKSYFNFK